MKHSRKPFKSHTSPRRTGQFALAVAFAAIIYLPMLHTALKPSKSYLREGWEEGRVLPRLTWSLSSILSFPKGFAGYFQFNFGYRTNLISMHTKLVGEALHGRVSKKVLEGKDGWLFLAEAGTIEDYRGLRPLSEKELERWRQTVESRHDWLTARGIHYVFVVCPDKHTIYPEYMPDRVTRVQPQTRLDQFIRYMQDHSHLEIIDLRPALWSLKKERLCYQPQESHWNDVGAFVGYQQIAACLRAWYPDLRVMDMKDCEIYQRENPSTDLLRLQGQSHLTTLLDSVRPISGFVAQVELDVNDRDEKSFQVRHSQRRDAPAGRLLMIHDSFGIPMVPFLAEHFREGWYVWSRGDRFFPQEVLTFKPDVVVQEMVERGFCEREPSPLGLAAPSSSKPDPERRREASQREPRS
jgi:alginate O-acetyltransferase complex protein AlgJ